MTMGMAININCYLETDNVTGCNNDRDRKSSNAPTKAGEAYPKAIYLFLTDIFFRYPLIPDPGFLDQSVLKSSSWLRERRVPGFPQFRPQK